MGNDKKEWKQIRNRLEKKVASAKDTSVILRRAVANPPLDAKRPNIPADYARDHNEGEPIPVFEKSTDKSSVELVKALIEGRINGKELPREERQLLVLELRRTGRTQDEIASLLRVSRNTIGRDIKALRKGMGEVVAKVDALSLAGEIYDNCMTWISKAVKEGSYRLASLIQKDMVEMLQSLGIVYKAPTQMDARILEGHVMVQKGFQTYLSQISGEEDKVVAVLDQVMATLAKKEEEEK